MDIRKPQWLAWIVFGAGLCSVGAVEIVAHRGASADAPENTLPSMTLAWNQNADAIELDLWLSADGKILVFHDSDTTRFESPARRISELTFAQARQLDVGQWKGATFKGEPIPTLESVLATIPSGRRAYLEIKCGPEIVPELGRVIEKSGRKPAEIVIISFRMESLRASKLRCPQLSHFLIHAYSKDPITQAYPQLEAVISEAKSAGLEGLDLNYQWPIDSKLVSRVKQDGLKLVVWTVDDPAVGRRLAEAGVDGLTTNKPQWLREQLKLPSSR